MYTLITGTTGVGKSSLINSLQNICKNILVFQDPYETNPFLSMAYQKGSMTFQSEIFFIKEFIKIHNCINNTKQFDIIQERSIYECVHIFAKQYLNNRIIDQREYDTLKDLMDLVSMGYRKPDVIIHLYADNIIIKNRLLQRNRNFESEIDIEFITYQEECYQDWLKLIYQDFKIPIIQLDTSVLTIEETYNKTLKLLSDFKL